MEGEFCSGSLVSGRHRRGGVLGDRRRSRDSATGGGGPRPNADETYGRNRAAMFRPLKEETLKCFSRADREVQTCREEAEDDGTILSDPPGSALVSRSTDRILSQPFARRTEQFFVGSPRSR